MRSIVISDTSCLILFHKIGHLELLHKVYDNIITTPEVVNEFSELIPEWIKIEKVKDIKYQEFLKTPSWHSLQIMCMVARNWLCLFRNLYQHILFVQIRCKVNIEVTIDSNILIK